MPPPIICAALSVTLDVKSCAAMRMIDGFHDGATIPSHCQYWNKESSFDRRRGAGFSPAADQQNRSKTDSRNGLTDKNAPFSIVPSPLMAMTIVTLIPAATSVHSIALIVRRSESQRMYFIFLSRQKFT